MLTKCLRKRMMTLSEYTSRMYNVADGVVLDELIQYAEHDAVLLQRTVCQFHNFQCINRLSDCELLYNVYYNRAT